MEGIRVVVMSNLLLMCEGIRCLLFSCPDIEVVGETTCNEEGMAVIRMLDPDVVLLDLTDCTPAVLENLSHFRQERTSCHLIAINYDRNEIAVMQTLKMGAQGFLCNTEGVTGMIAAIRSVAADNVYLCPGACGTLIREYRRKLRQVQVV